ncbi:uncharacterized protein LOC110845278 isoform X2 [Folsomia candida]|nr:uncharacterized protein LOC110845278 isoform X2 [Folsomia candida]
MMMICRFLHIIFLISSLKPGSSLSSRNSSNSKVWKAPKVTDNLVTLQSFLDKVTRIGTSSPAPVPPPDALARYAFTYHFLKPNDTISITSTAATTTTATTTQSSGGNSTMAASAIQDVMSQIQDPFKHGVTSALLAGLYILALVSLTVFATTGTIAFVCSFVDCRNFFLGMKPDSSMPRRMRSNEVIGGQSVLFGGTPIRFWDEGWPEMVQFFDKLQPYHHHT